MSSSKSDQDKKGNLVAGSKADWELGSPRSLEIDWRIYEEYLEDENLTEEQKQEFLEGLWSIMVSFVDMGFELHPVQQVSDENLQKLPVPDSPDMLKSDNSNLKNNKAERSSRGK